MLNSDLNISGADLGRLAGVSRASVSIATSKGTLIKVDKKYSLENPHNQGYLTLHSVNVPELLEKLKKSGTDGKEKNTVKKINVAKPKDKKMFGVDVPAGMSAVDPDNSKDKPASWETIITLNEAQTKTQIQQEVRLRISNNKELNNLIERDLMVKVFGEMGQSIQRNVVDQSKRKSNMWANLLGIPARERDVEKLLEDLGEEIVNSLISDIERLINIDAFINIDIPEEEIKK